MFRKIAITGDQQHMVNKNMNPPVPAYSGTKCPRGGVWKVLGNLTTTQPVSRGDPMPLYCGKKVKWKFLYKI